MNGRPVENTKYLSEAMKKAPQLGMTVVAHCEDLFLADGGKINGGEVSENLGVKGIPAAAEDCGTARRNCTCGGAVSDTHYHVSTKTKRCTCKRAKRRGVRITAETAPHYFSMTEKECLQRTQISE